MNIQGWLPLGLTSLISLQYSMSSTMTKYLVKEVIFSKYKILMLSLELEVISNSVSIPQIRQEYTPLHQEVAKVIVTPFPPRAGDNLNRNGTKSGFLCQVYDYPLYLKLCSLSFSVPVLPQDWEVPEKRGDWNGAELCSPLCPQPTFCLWKNWNHRISLIKAVKMQKQENSPKRLDNTLVIKHSQGPWVHLQEL